MAAEAGLTDRIDTLVRLFNRKGMDLPDGLFDRRTQFLLNGTPFEDMLGRSPADPLALLIARGPAGYRFAMKALQHAVPDARVERGEIDRDPQAADAWRVPLWLSGHLRDTGQPVETVLRVRLGTAPGGVVVRAEVGVDDTTLSALRRARLEE